MLCTFLSLIAFLLGGAGMYGGVVIINPSGENTDKLLLGVMICCFSGVVGIFGICYFIISYVELVKTFRVCPRV